MKHARPIPSVLACLAMAAVLGSCERVSLEPGSAAARPVTFQISIELPSAPADGTASWDVVPPPTIAFSTQGSPSPVSATITHTLTGLPSYRWYLNGEPVTDASPDDTLSVGGVASDTGALAIGNYRLSAVVTDTDAIATVDWVFEVIDE